MPAIISPTKPKPKSTMPQMTIVSTRLSSGRKPTPKPNRSDQGDDPGEEADEEQHRAGDAEEQHRLAAEAQLEPDREQVEDARPGSGAS